MCYKRAKRATFGGLGWFKQLGWFKESSHGLGVHWWRLACRGYVWICIYHATPTRAAFHKCFACAYDLLHIVLVPLSIYEGYLPLHYEHLPNNFRPRTTISMSSSKFVELLDTNVTPYSQDNVSLDDVLAETRRRSASGSSSSSSSEKSPTRSPTSPNSHAVKTRLRGFSLRKSKT